jgi:predicted Zn-dependent peptidase
VIEATQLSNGIPVVVDRVPHTRAVCVGLWLTLGSRDEGQSEHGFAHILEHMLFKGTERRTAARIALDVDRVGGALNAFTEKEVTCYHCTVPREALPLAVDVLADMIRRPLLEESELQKEKNVILNEIYAADDSAEEVAHELYIEGVFASGGVARRITGTASEVKSATEHNLREFYRRSYGARTMIVGIAGDVPHAEALELVGQALGDWPAAGLTPERAPAAPGRIWTYRPGRSEQLHFYAGLASGGAQPVRDYYVTLVFSTLVGESMSSRLFQSLREAHALCYSVMTFRTQLSDASMLTIYASTTPQAGARFLEMLSRELSRLRSDPPSLQEVDDAKSHLRGSLLLSQEDVETRMKRAVRQTLSIGSALECEQSLAHLAAVSRQDILDVVEERIRADRFSLLAYGGRRFGAFRRASFRF